MAKYIKDPKAVVLADSISPQGIRLTTMEVTMHRFVLAEFNTHRVFSRNSASSRAIPGRLQRERVLTVPAEPLAWPSKQSGMQGGEEVMSSDAIRAGMYWRKAAMQAATVASQLDDLGIHKSVTNRLLEPFLMQTVIVSSTEWDGFFAQRDSELAQPEIAVPARLMREAYEESTPKNFELEQRYNLPMWHLPLIDDQTHAELIERVAADTGIIIGTGNSPEYYELATKVSAARCARVSYLTHDGTRDIDKDLELYERLVTADPPHWSPLEHVATPCPTVEDKTVNRFTQQRVTSTRVHVGSQHKGNFTGWDQLRHLV